MHSAVKKALKRLLTSLTGVILLFLLLAWLQFFFQGKGNHMARLQSLHPFLKVKSPAELDWRDRDGGWRHFTVTEGSAEEKRRRRRWTMTWSDPTHLGYKKNETYCKLTIARAKNSSSLPREHELVVCSELFHPAEVVFCMCWKTSHYELSGEFWGGECTYTALQGTFQLLLTQ